MYGRHQLFVSNIVQSDPATFGIQGAGPPPRYNVLDALEGASDAFKRSLSSAEQANVFKVFSLAARAIFALSHARKLALVPEGAPRDLRIVVERLLTFLGPLVSNEGDHADRQASRV